MVIEVPEKKKCPSKEIVDESRRLENDSFCSSSRVLFRYFTIRTPQTIWYCSSSSHDQGQRVKHWHTFSFQF